MGSDTVESLGSLKGHFFHLFLDLASIWAKKSRTTLYLCLFFCKVRISILGKRELKLNKSILLSSFSFLLFLPVFFKKHHLLKANVSSKENYIFTITAADPVVVWCPPPPSSLYGFP